MEKRRPALVAAALCFVISLFSWGAYYSGASHLIHRNAKVIREKVNRLRPIELQLNELRKQVGALDSLAMPLMAAISQRNFWLQTIEELNARLPEQDIWVTELVGTSKGILLDGSEMRIRRPEPSRPPSAGLSGPLGTEIMIDGVLLRGLYLANPRQQEVVVNYFRNMTGSPWFAIEEKNQADVLKPTTPTETEWAFPYELRAGLRNPVKFP